MEDRTMTRGKLGFPSFVSNPRYTFEGTPYLTTPGVALIARPEIDLNGVRGFLAGFPETKFEEYLNDPDPLPPAEQVIKLAGQLCYMSFGKGRSWNKDAERYLGHIRESGHGSVLEHANFSMLWYGISRSLTHEAVRHRAGFAYSQLSQRYVSGKLLRFVERKEYQNDETLHRAFLQRIDRAYREYETVASHLLSLQTKGDDLLSAERKTDERKKINQVARSLLPNETETALVVTGNVRAWRHFVEMRAHEAAEIEIRELAYLTYLCLKEEAPILFSDYEVITLPDRTRAIQTKTRKV